MPKPPSPLTSTSGSFIGEPGPPGAPGPGFTAGGDLTGTSTSQTVVKIQGRPISSAAPSINNVLSWDGAQWEPAVGGGGSGFTAGGDLFGTSTSQTVSSIRGVISPDPTDASIDDTVIVQESIPTPAFVSPRSVVTDGAYLYIAESAMIVPYGSAIVRKVSIAGGGTSIGVIAQIDLSTILGTIDRIRDLAIDDTYIYAACWTSENVAIIDKTTMAIAGWGWMGAGKQATSVCADNAGNFYCYAATSPYPISKFSTAACLGQPPSTITSTADYLAARGRWIRFGGGYIWYTDGNNAPIGIEKIDPTTMTSVISNPAVNPTLSSFYAFGSIWVTDYNGANVYRLDPTTLVVQATVVLPGSASNPSEFTLGPDNTGTANARIYLSDEFTGDVIVIDPSTDTVETTITINPLSSFEGLANIGNFVYAMGFLNGSSVAMIGYVNYPAGTFGQTSNSLGLVYSPRAIPDVSTALNRWIPTVQESLPEPDLISPRQVLSDGTYLYIAEYDSSAPWGSAIIRKVLPSADAKTVSLVASIDLSVSSGLFVTGVDSVGQCVRDIAQDSTYLYAACGPNYWGTITTFADNIAIIDKATMTVVGWGWMGSGRRAGSVCADGAGNFYCNSSVYVSKFSTAACLGQPPNTIAPASTYTGSNGEWIRYGGGNIYFVDGGNSTFGIRRIVASTMTLGASNATNTPLHFVLAAFGSVWAAGNTSLYRMDATTLAVTATIPISSAGTLNYIWTGPNSAGTADARLYITDLTKSRVNIIDPSLNSIEAVITLGGGAYEGMAVIGNYVYAMAFHTGGPTGVYYINYPESTSGKTHFPRSLVYSPSLAKQRATDMIGDYYDRQVSGSGNYYYSVVRTIPVIADSQSTIEHIAVDTYEPVEANDGPTIWLARYGEVISYNTSTAKVFSHIPIVTTSPNASWTPATLLVTPKYVWTLDNLFSQIAKIDRVTKQVYETIKLPSRCEGLVWDEANDRILTANYNINGAIVSIDATTHEVRQYSINVSENGRGLIAVGTDVFFFGTANFWKVPISTWIPSAPTAIPTPSAGRIRPIYAAGYIFFISVNGSVLARVDPATLAISSISVGSSTYGVTYDPETPSVWVTRSTVGFQQVTSPTGVMALGTATARTDTLRDICWDPYSRLMYFGSVKTTTPKNAWWSYITKTGAVTDLSPFNLYMDWETYNNFEKYINLSDVGAPHTLSEYNKLVFVQAHATLVKAYTLNLPTTPPVGTRITVTDATAGYAYAALTVTIQANAADRFMSTLGGSTTVVNGQTKEFIFTIFGSTKNWIWH